MSQSQHQHVKFTINMASDLANGRHVPQDVIDHLKECLECNTRADAALRIYADPQGNKREMLDALTEYLFFDAEAAFMDKKSKKEYKNSAAAKLASYIGAVIASGDECPVTLTDDAARKAEQYTRSFINKTRESIANAKEYHDDAAEDAVHYALVRSVLVSHVMIAVGESRKGLVERLADTGKIIESILFEDEDNGKFIKSKVDLKRLRTSILMGTAKEYVRYLPNWVRARDQRGPNQRRG